MAFKAFVFLAILATASAQEFGWMSGLRRGIGATVLELLGCVEQTQRWNCVKDKAARILDSFESNLDVERRKWGEAADAEVRSTGRQLKEAPSQLAQDVETSLNSLADILETSVARALSRKKDEGGIDTITVTTSKGGKKSKKKKKKQPQIHVVQAQMEKGQIFKANPQTWTVGSAENDSIEKDNRRHKRDTWTPIPSPIAFDLKTDLPNGQRFVDGNNQELHVRKQEKLVMQPRTLKFNDNTQTKAIEPTILNVNDGTLKVEPNTLKINENTLTRNTNRFIPLKENVIEKLESIEKNGMVVSGRNGRGIMDALWNADVEAENALNEMTAAALKPEYENGGKLEESRGKKKKKKKAILKLLLLGAVLKAKIGTLLQILSAKLQIKFFIVAVIGLAINLARFWLDLKKSHQPQKVIYYEHAQHQHHYEHDDEEHGWGPWSRTNEEGEGYGEDNDAQGRLPYRGYRPAYT